MPRDEMICEQGLFKSRQNPTDLFTFLEPWNQESSEFNVVQKPLMTDFGAPKLSKDRSGSRVGGQLVVESQVSRGQIFAERVFD